MEGLKELDGSATASPSPAGSPEPEGAKLPFADAVEFFSNLVDEFKDAKHDTGEFTVTLRRQEFSDLYSARRSLRAALAVFREMAAARNQD